MAIKKFYVENIGEILVTKRKKTKRINLRVVGGQVKVTQPYWLPFSGGLKFALRNQNWITKQQYSAPTILIKNGTAVGFDHTIEVKNTDNLRCTVTKSKITVSVPLTVSLSDKRVILSYKNAVKRALKSEAEKYLPERVAEISKIYGFSYGKLSYKAMKSRWGSCNSKKNISINIFLLMTSWDLIDYVIVHELVHTKHMHHGQEFWAAVAKIIPDYKARQKKLKKMQIDLSPYQS